MLNTWHRVTATVRRVFQLAVLLCTLRFVVGAAAIALFDRSAVAWGPELFIVVLATFAVLSGVAFALRRMAPPEHHPI